MISGCYLLSGVLLAVTAWLFDSGVLTATTQTIAWMVVFFFASAGASAAYLTVSEIFPMETRALAIAFFYAVGTGLGGIIGPVLFGNLIATKRPFDTAIGYLIGAGLMIAAGLVEVAIGVDAEQKSLEELARPLSAEGDDNEAGNEPATPADVVSLDRVTGRYPAPRLRLARQSWAPFPQVSDYPKDNPYLAGEVDRIVEVLGRDGPLSASAIAGAVGARAWGPGRSRGALQSGLTSGRIRRLGRDRYVVADEEVTRDSDRDHGAGARSGRR
jgi:MFS family permease